jgi:adenine-specific DNA methylase
MTSDQLNQLSVADASQICTELLEAGAAAALNGTTGQVILTEDLDELSAVTYIDPPRDSGNEPRLPLIDGLDDADSPQQWLSLPRGGLLVPLLESTPGPAQLGPTIRLLVDHKSEGAEQGGPIGHETDLPGGWRLYGGPPSLHKKADELMNSSQAWARLANKDFANSAPYMGTKRTLLPFLMPAIEGMTDHVDSFVDLMCGSGVVAGAASRRWRTIGSDAQQFSRALAVVQGGGFSEDRASATLRRLREPMAENFSALSGLVSDLLSEEAQLLSIASDWSSLASRYAEFSSNTPGYPGGGTAALWNPLAEVEERQHSIGIVKPFCLLTAYFSNVYFGIRQAVELDCWRYAIDQLTDPLEQDWALGALIVAASSIATTYGGHFAQPSAPPERLVKPSVAKRVLTRRHISATREFEIRFLSLGRASEGVAHAVETVDGPWQMALSEATKLLDPARSVVYLDAPYRREEYSRYYHVLETLTSYGYPSAKTAARIPDKGTDRFASEFFTRNRSAMIEALSSTIRSILDAGFFCAWSYADRADADALSVLESVAGASNRIRSVSSDHDFKRQGRSKDHGRVREYLFLLDPKK